MTGINLRLGLIGAGRWGHIYIKTLANVAGVKLVRLASSNPASKTLIGDDCEITVHWHDVAGANDLDGVIIATPPDCHGEMVRAAINAGMPVLVEKPLTLDLKEARDLLALANKKTAIVRVNHIHLYHPAYVELKRQSLNIGPIQAINSIGGDWGPFRKHIPMIWDRGSHDIAMCLDIMGEMPKTISASVKEAKDTVDGFGETIIVKLTFANGVTANIENSNLMEQKKRFIAVHYQHATLIYDDVADDQLIKITSGSGVNKDSVAIKVSPTPPLTCAVMEFVKAIRLKDSNLNDLRLGANVVNVLQQCDDDINKSKASV